VDTAVAYDQLVGMTAQAKAHVGRLEAIVGRLTVARHDLKTVNEAAAVLEALTGVADRTEAAALAAAIAAELEAAYGGVPSEFEDAKDPELERERHRVASHEGGHAVLCSRYGFPILSGEIDVSRTFFGMGKIDESGFVQFEPGQLTEKKARDIGAVCYAGAEATVQWHLLDGEAPPTARRLGYEGSSHDMALAAEVLGGDRKLLLAAQRQATTEVVKRWPSIQSVAERFMERERLSGAQIERAV
jgi:hypothetical protein